MADKLLEFKAEVDRCSRDKKLQGKSLKLIVVESQQYDDGFLKVTNDLPLEVICLFDWETAAHYLLEGKGKVDPNRNHLFQDFGWCGNGNSERIAKYDGIGHPRTHNGTMTEISIAAFLAQSKAICLLWPEAEPWLYMDPPRMKHFAQEIHPDNRLEATRIATQIFVKGGQPFRQHLLGNHVDSSNDGRDPNFGYVNCTSVILVDRSLKQAVRQCTVGYGKEAAYNFMQRSSIYGPLLKEIKILWEGLPEEEKRISASMIPSPAEGEKVLSHPHCVKTVTFSSYAEVFLRLLRKYPMLQSKPYTLASLWYCSIVSECPQYFWYEGNKLVDDPCFIGEQHFLEYKHTDYGWLFYQHLFGCKQSSSISYETVQRLLCSHNEMASRFQFDNSVELLVRIVDEVRATDMQDLHSETKFYYHKINGYMSQNCPQCPVDTKKIQPDWGVFGASTFLANHLIGVASCFGHLPPCFLTYAEIGQGTRTWQWMVSERGFDDKQYAVQSVYLLDSVSSMLSIGHMTAEEVNWRNKQNKTGQEGRFRQTLFPDCPLYELDQNGLSVNRLFRDGVMETVLSSQQYHEPAILVQEGQSSFWQVKFPHYASVASRNSSRKRRPRSVCRYFPLHYPRQGSCPTLATACQFLTTPNPEAVVRSCQMSRSAKCDIISTTKRALTGDGQCSERGLFLLKVLRFNTLTQEFIDPVGKGQNFDMASEKTGNSDGRKLLGKRKPRDDKRRRQKRKRAGVNVAHCSNSLLTEHHLERNKHWVTYHACGIFLDKEIGNHPRKLHWPSHTFPIRRDYVREQNQNSPHSPGLLPHSVVHDGMRYFMWRDSAKEYACWSLILNSPEIFQHRVKLDTFLWHSFDDDDLDSDDSPYNQGMAAKESRQMLGYRVIYSSNGKRSKQCCGVVSHYRKGGKAFYLVDQTGKRISGIFLRIPPNLAKRTLSPPTVENISHCLTKYEYLGIINHRLVREGNCLGPQVRIKWWDRTTTWEPLHAFSIDAYWDCYQYASENDLLDKKYWRFLAHGGKSSYHVVRSTIGIDNWGSSRDRCVYHRGSMNTKGGLSYHGGDWFCD